MAINLNNPYGMVGIQPEIGTITPPPTPAPTIPGFTGFGDRLATIGGFGDDPNELKTQEELARMTQAQIDEYTKQRKMARRSGVSEALIQFGEALQGKPAVENAMKRKQALQNMEMQKQYQAEYQSAIQTAEQTNPNQARLLKSLGLPGFVSLQQKRAEQMFLGGGGSSKRLSVFDPKTKQPVATVLESDIQGIAQAEARGYIVAPLSGPKDRDKDETTEFERNITELTKLKNIPEQQRTDTDVRNIKIYENKLLKTSAPKIYQVVGPDRTGIGLGTYDEFIQGQDTGLYPPGSTIVNIPTDTQAPPSKQSQVFSAENKPFADRWQATSTLLDNLQNYTNELDKMDEAALTGTGAGAKFATSVIQNTKGFLKLASSDTKSYYNDQVANNTYTTVEGNDFMERLNRVSDQFGVNESQVRDLAYLFAAARGQEGRGLSDKDYENALLIVSGGVGKRGKIAVIESVYNRLGGEVSKTVDNRVKTLEYLRNNSEENQREYFDKQILQLNALRDATPFNTYTNPYAQQTPSASSLQNDPLGIR